MNIFHLDRLTLLIRWGVHS